MNTIYKIALILFFINSYSQSPVLNLHTEGIAGVENAYYKDIENFYNQFEGTWVYTDANKVIKFKFAKKEMFNTQLSKNCFIDYLVGEIHFIENDLEKISSFNNLNTNFSSIYSYSLYSFGKTKMNIPNPCIGCSSSYGVSMRYNEPQNNDICLTAGFFMHRFIESGVEKIKVQYYLTNSPCGLQNDWETPSTTTNFLVPYGDYVFTRE
jgi:hypothetical protein